MMVPRARPRVVLLTLFAVAVPVHAGQNPVFDVASVRRAPSAPFSFPGLMLQPSGRATSPGSSVRQLILTAYGLDDLQLIGGPAWIASDLYAIEARTVEGATRANVRLMLRALLQERFQLAVHSETRDLPASAIGSAIAVHCDAGRSRIEARLAPARGGRAGDRSHRAAGRKLNRFSSVMQCLTHARYRRIPKTSPLG